MKKNKKVVTNIVFSVILILCFVLGIVIAKLWVEIDNSELSLIDQFNYYIGRIDRVTLTKENYEEIANKYIEKYFDTDNYYYYAYASLYHTIKSGTYHLYAEDYTQDTSYEDIYGKRIVDLVKEGKKFMKEKNLTLSEVKKAVLEIRETVNEMNKSIDELNSYNWD